MIYPVSFSQKQIEAILINLSYSTFTNLCLTASWSRVASSEVDVSVFYRVLAKAGVSDPHQFRLQHRHYEDESHGFKITSPRIKIFQDELKTSHILRAKSVLTFIHERTSLKQVVSVPHF